MIKIYIFALIQTSENYSNLSLDFLFVLERNFLLFGVTSVYFVLFNIITFCLLIKTIRFLGFFFFLVLQAIKAFCHFHEFTLNSSIIGSSILVVTRLSKSLLTINNQRCGAVFLLVFFPWVC